MPSPVRPSIGLHMIVRDCAEMMEPCLTSIIGHVDEIVAVDTGSEDDRTERSIRRIAPRATILPFTPQEHPEAFLLDVAETWKGKVPGPFTGKWMLADFSAARQEGWQRGTTDYLLWIDSDDVVEGAEHLPSLLREMAKNGFDTALIDYIYDDTEKGDPTCLLRRERILRRALNSRWTQPVHEVLSPGGLGGFFSDLRIRHRRHRYRKNPLFHHRNLKILLHWFERNAHLPEDKIDPRMVFYLAKEEMALWPEKAITDLERYLRFSGWDEERASAHILTALLHMSAKPLPRIDRAFLSYAAAALEYPDNPDGLYGCAEVAFYKQNWRKVIEYTEKAQAIIGSEKPASSIIQQNPFDRSWRPHVFYSAALIEMGQYEKAARSAETGLALQPGHPELKDSLDVARKGQALMNEKTSPVGQVLLSFHRDEPIANPPIEIPLNVLITFALQLWKRSLAESAEKALRLLDSLPDTVKKNESMVEARAHTMRAIESTGGRTMPSLPSIPTYTSS